MSQERSSQAMTKPSETKIPFWVKLGYGGFEGSYGLIWVLFYMFFMFFATDVVGLSPMSAGLIMMLSGIGDAISDPLTGIISDKINTRWGRRRPILLAVALPYGLITWLLFTDPGWSEAATTIYFSIMAVVFYTVIDLVWTPGLALGAEMTLDYDERTSLAGYRTGWDFASSIITLSICLLMVKFFTGRLGSAKAGWSAMAASFGIIATLPILLTWRVTRGYEKPRTKEPNLSAKEIWQAVVGNKALLPIIGIYAFAGASFNCVSSAAMYYFTYYLKYNEEQSSLLFGTMGLMQLVWVPILSWLGQKFDKRHVIIYIYVASTIFFAIIWFVQPMNGQEISMIIVLMGLLSCLSPAVFLIVGAMIADTVEVDEFKTGQRREGVYFSVASFVQKIGIAFILWGTGALLEWSGYVPKAEQNAVTILAIRSLISWIPAVLIAISTVFALLNTMTKEKHALLRKAIASKKAGETCDIESIKGLVQ
jgi:sugar (glycoside-pentoside-hexuronide) transporter